MACNFLTQEPMGKQALKSERSRDAMCRAAINCLAETGYAETSINRVVERGGFSKGALQHHYPSKEDLIAAVVDTLLERSQLSLVDGACTETKSPEDYLRLIWSDLIDTRSYLALLEILVAVRTDLPLRTRLEPQLRKWHQRLDNQARVIFPATISSDADEAPLLLMMTRALYRGLVIEQRYTEDNQRIERAVERWITLIAPLLGSVKNNHA